MRQRVRGVSGTGGPQRNCPAVSAAAPTGWPCGPDTTCPPHLSEALPAAVAVRAPRPAAHRTSCHVRGGDGKDHHARPRSWPACARRPDTCPGRGPSRTPAWPRVRTPAVRTAVVPEAADGQSADRSGSLQLPLLFLKQRPAAALRPGSDTTPPGAGLTLHVGRYESTPPHERRFSPAVSQVDPTADPRPPPTWPAKPLGDPETYESRADLETRAHRQSDGVGAISAQALP